MRLPVGLPLWPFADAASASASAASWTSDPSQTASRFTTLHLGFTDDNLVLSTTKSSDGQQAWVSVGYRTEGPRTATAAVAQLLRGCKNRTRVAFGQLDATPCFTLS